MPPAKQRHILAVNAGPIVDHLDRGQSIVDKVDG